MRLTLRTMLAYLDDILEPEDRADIGKKIEDSEFATDLVHRTRDVVRRLRLGAPRVTGRGMGGDPNTVAEYLDNTMPAERVADFEKVCLESDVHLAEVAACHQVLTLVLGEPAEVSAASREKMYHIPAVLEQTVSEQAKETPENPVPIVESPAAPTRQKRRRNRPEVPDYLRESRRSRRKTRILVALVLLVAAVTGLVAYDRNWIFVAQDEAAPYGVEVDKLSDPSVDMGLPLEPTTSGTEGITSGTSGAKTGEPLEAAPPFVPGGAAPSSPTTPTPQPTAPAQPAPDSGAEPAPVVDLPELPAQPEPEAPQPTEPPSNPMVPEIPEAQSPETQEPELQENDAQIPPEPADLENGPATDFPAEGGSGAGGEPTQATPQVGTYVSNDTVLLRWNQASSQWLRLPPRAALVENDRLLTLPTFRPTITLTSGVPVQMAGGSSVTLLPADADGTPVLELQSGRIVLMGVGRPDTRVRIQFGGRSYVVSLGNGNSTLAVAVKRWLPLGSDPESSPASVIADLYVADGSVIWDADGGKQAVRAPAAWQIPGGSPPLMPTSEPLPEWINAEVVSAIDRRASLELDAGVPLDRSVGLSLLELVDRRQVEVRALAARSSMFVGHFQPFVASLNDSDQRAVWATHIETLREALAQSPEVAREIRDAFTEQRSEDGAALYRMLWGYTAEQLDKGAAKDLVEKLDHEKLDFRVLAFWNLKTITGLGLTYRPEYNASRRAQSVRSWKERLAKGEIVPLQEAAPASGKPKEPVSQRSLFPVGVARGATRAIR